MNIYEAAKKANEEGKAMLYGSGQFQHMRFILNNQKDTIVVLNLRNGKSCGNWNPKLEDLLRTDWEVIKLPSDIKTNSLFL